MARVVNEAAFASRRDEFLDVAQRLLEVKGYEQLSVHEVLTEVGASKGAFYHYFSSKQALLEAVIERMAGRAAAHLAAVVEEPRLPALDKLQHFFAALAGWKVQRRDLLVALLRVWISDDNAMMRQKTRQSIADRIAPLLAGIISQGVDEGVFTAAHPEEHGRVVVSLIQDLNDRLAELFLDHASSRGDLQQARRTVAAYTDALERILGAPTGTVTLVDVAILNRWPQPEPHRDGDA
jgi:AcrR family transcriptional regulator